MSGGVSEQVDLVVVGAGPAGCAAAIEGARAGLRVQVFDKAAFPRDKTCGDGLTVGALRTLASLGFEPTGLASWLPIRETVLTGPDGRRVVLPLPADGLFAATVMRRDLDAALVARARVEGADVVEGCGVTGVRHEAGLVVSELADGREVAARFLVAADGMWSSVRKSLDAPTPAATPTYLGEMHAFRQYFHGFHDTRLHVVFIDDLLPGYLWVFPLAGGLANVGFGVHRRPGVTTRYLARLWPELLAAPVVRSILGDARPLDDHRAWPIPARLDRRPLTAGRVLFVGDAAAAGDPLTGEGIAQALETGTWAARAVIAGGRSASPSTVTDDYEHRVARDLAVDQRFARGLAAVMQRPRLSRMSLRLVDSTDWTRRSFARWMWEDYPRGLLLTPRRWRRGAMSGSGVRL